MSDPTRILGVGRSFGEPYGTRIYGSPLEPTGRVAHQAWFAGGRGGEVGALRLGEVLHLCVGANGSGWRIVGDTVEALSFQDPQPDALDAGDQAVSEQALSRRGPLAAMGWCAVRPLPGERFLLCSGIEVTPSTLDLGMEAEALVAAIPEPQAPGFFGRLLGKSGATEGAVVLLSCEVGESAPDGWLPWLAFHDARGLEFHCWGTEGGTEMAQHQQDPPDRSAHDALLEVARTHPAIVKEQFADLYDDEAPRDPRLQELVPGCPERGFWVAVDLDELAEVFVAHTSNGPGMPLRSDEFMPGERMVEQLRLAVEEPTAIALQPGHEEEAVVVWFIVGGVSKSSGQLECILSERVWT